MSDLILIFSMALVTFLPRYLPFGLASRIRLPNSIMLALPYIPIAVLTIIVVQTIFVSEGRVTFELANPYLWAAIAAIVTAIIQRHLYITILIGLSVYLSLKLLF